MAARDLLVRILGDSSSLERSFLKSTATGKVFGNQMEQTGRKVDKSLSGLRSLATGRGFAGGLVATAALAGLRQLVDAAANSQQVLGQTKVALEDTGLSWDKYGKQIESAAAALVKLGFDDEETLKSISTFARATGDVSKAIADTALAADIARARYIDLAAASNIVLKASLGQAGALRRIGIDAENGSSSIKLLTLLQQKYGGSASKAVGDATTANARLRTSLQNVEEQIGSGLLPVVATLAGELSDAADNATSLVSSLQNVKVPGLGSAKGFDITKALKLGALATPGVQIFAAEKALLDKLGISGDGKPSGDATAKAEKFGKTFGITSLANVIRGAQEGAKSSTGVTAAQRNTFFDNAVSRALFRADDLNPQGQLAALKKVSDTLTARIAITKDITRKLNLEDQVISVNRQRKSIEQQLSDQLAQRLADAKQANIEKKAEDLVKLRERQAAALAKVQATQFRALGFSATGGDVVAGADNLRKQLASLTDRLGDSGVKLSSKLQQSLKGVRTVLSGDLGKITVESREKIQELFATIRQEFDKGASSGAPLTKTHALNANKILEGLGLSPADERELKSRLSQFNSAGVGLGGATRPGAGGKVNVTVNVKSPDVFLDNNKVSASVRNANTIHGKRNPKQKRGS